MKITIIGFSLIIALSGCSVFQDEDYFFSNADATDSDALETSQQMNESFDQPHQASIDFQQRYQQKLIANMPDDPKHKQNNALSMNINDYVRVMMQDLVSNLHDVNQSTPMAVTSFVELDGDYASSNLLGNQLAESFVHEVHKFGIPVVDFKVTDFIRVTEQGDFILSRDFKELTPNLPVKYVLAGTLAKQKEGMLVNARIIEIKSKNIVATAQGVLPENIIDALLDVEIPKNVQLVKE